MKSLLVMTAVVAAAPGYAYNPPTDAVDVPVQMEYGAPSAPEVEGPYGGEVTESPVGVGPYPSVPVKDYAKAPTSPVDEVPVDDTPVEEYYKKPTSPVDETPVEEYYKPPTSPIDEVPSYGDSDPVDPVDETLVKDYYKVPTSPVDKVPSYGYSDPHPVDPVTAHPTPIYEDPDCDSDCEVPDIDLPDEYHHSTPAPTPTADPCDHYPEDYESCLLPTDTAPICEPATETVYETQTYGTPACVYETETKTSTSICATATMVTTETHTITDLCHPVTTTEVHPTTTKSVCAGTITAEPKTFTDYVFEYDVTYIHPTVVVTETLMVTPEPYTKTEYVETTVHATETQIEVDYVTETVKETPVVTEIHYEGCATESYYKTEYPEPVYTTVTKTIHVPKGCIDDVEVCPTPTPGYYEDVYSDPDVDWVYPPTSPVDEEPSYGGSDPTSPVDGGNDYGKPLSSVDEVPSYGAVDPTSPVDTSKSDYTAPTSPEDTGKEWGNYGPTSPVDQVPVASKYPTAPSGVEPTY